ncbi:MAG: glycosyl hydrolase family 18 protein [Lachnospiraceae bacterium]
MKKQRINRRGKQVLATLGIFFIIFILLGTFLGVKVYQKYSPTKERMSYKDYFEMKSLDDVLVYLNDEPLMVEEDGQSYMLTVLYEDGRCYLPRTYVEKNLNCRFYEEKSNNSVKYTVADNIYEFAANESYYTDMNGKTVDTDYVVVKQKDDEFYIAIDYVKEHADFEYRFYEEPYRLLMWTEYEEKTFAKLNKDTAIRFRGGIKSPIICDGLADQEVEVLEDYEDWIEVRTEDGYLGYIKAGRLGETYTRTMTSTYVPDEKPVSTKFDGKINLVFQSIGSAAYASPDEALATTKGVNVISPTWYMFGDNNGNLVSFANKEYVKKCHAKGVDVWALFKDFDSSADIDKEALLSNEAMRKKIIDRLISDADEYGFDGINIDFEHISRDMATHYLQFIRELSFECRAKGIILSIDNYAPANFNLYYNRTEQGIWADYLVIMGYDEHYSGSEEAGPVASIGYVRDGVINTLKEVPAEKVINAMPFYVRVWKETKNTDGSITLSSRALGMAAAREILDNAKVPIQWDEEKGLYYGAIEDGNETTKIWLEDDRSIEEKMKVYKEYDLAGVGGWRLGLEKRSTWDVIAKYLN